MAHFQQIGDVGEILARHDFEIGHHIRVHIDPPRPAGLSGVGVSGGIWRPIASRASDGLIF
jgi:hypothetical protein